MVDSNFITETMQDFYNLFHQQVKSRINKYQKLYSFGEDSIRYDFYHSALNFFELSPIDLILEQAIPESQFTAKERDREALKQGRHSDKPEFDLRIDNNSKLKSGIIVEFAYFRKTEISLNQDKTGRHGKLLNEIFRLALLKQYRNTDNKTIYKDFSNYLCLLVCVTDDEMINYGHNKRGRKPIPIQNEYKLSEEYISKFPNTVRGSINNMFSQKAKELNIIPTADKIFEKVENGNAITPRWATWIWEVNFKNNH